MIIDTHVHTGVFEDVDRVVNMSQEIVLESMDLYHIDFALVSNAAVEYDCEWQPVPMEKQKSQEAYFQEAIEFARANPKKIGVLPWVKPANETVTEELESLIKENRDVVYGIKVHPFHSKIAFDSPQVEEYIKLARKYHLPVITHTADCDEASSVRVYNMAKKYPDVDFVMAHMDLGTDNQTAIEMLGKLPNLYGDTTWVSLESTLQAIQLYGSKKIMFGSDNPIDGVHTYAKNPKGEPSLYQRYFNELEALIGTEAYEDVMYKNAMRVFGIQLHAEN
jgi:predicted TIM-barrel fold metal-dependent hydrolase